MSEPLLVQYVDYILGWTRVTPFIAGQQPSSMQRHAGLGRRGVESAMGSGPRLSPVQLQEMMYMACLLCHVVLLAAA
jgi:hypothetical protein